jgi:hypothetical protein
METLTLKTDVFDAGAIALALATLVVFHPGVLLPGPDEVEKSIYETVETTDHVSEGGYRP